MKENTPKKFIEYKIGERSYFTSDGEIKVGDHVIQTNFEKTNNCIIKIENEMQCKFANDKKGSFTKRKIVNLNG